MCNFCNGREDFEGERGKIWMQQTPFIDDVPKLHVWIGSEVSIFDIKYCPLCGKRLEDVRIL